MFFCNFYDVFGHLCGGNFDNLFKDLLNILWLGHIDNLFSGHLDHRIYRFYFDDASRYA